MAVSEGAVEKARQAADLTEEQMKENENRGSEDAGSYEEAGVPSWEAGRLERAFEGNNTDFGVEDPHDYPMTPDERVDSAISDAKGYIARSKNPNLLRSGSAERLSAERPEPTAYDSLITGREGVGNNGTHLKSVGDAASGGGTVVGTGMRLADDRSWEKDYKAMLQRRAAARAGRRAAADEREALLASGKYFDDGRGNIKLKKAYREKRRPDSTRRGRHVDTRPDDGAAALAMNKAAQTAYDASMKGWQDALNEQNAEKASASRKKVDDVISLNRQSLKNIETMKAERAKNQARSKFNMVEGYIAAMDALKAELANTDESSFSPIKAWGRGVDGSGKDENGRDARWKYDDNGRVIGQAEAQPTGKYMKKGFVTWPALQALNQRIREHGGNYKIVGLMATQKFNDVKGSAYGKPVVYARIETFDEASGKPVYHDEVFTPERAYELGMEAGKEGGIDDYKNLVWQGVGDIHGEREREVAAANLKHRQKLELEAAKTEGRLKIAQLNEEGRDRRNDANLQQKRDEVVARLKMDFAKMKSTDSGRARFAMKNIPEAVWKTILAPQPMRDEKTGELITDDATGQPIMRPPTYDETMKLLDGVTAWGVKNFGNDKGEGGGTTQAFVDAVEKAKGISPAQATQAAQGVQTQTSGDAILNEMQGGKPPAANGGNAATQAAQPSAPSANRQESVQSKDNPIPSPTGETTTTHNKKRYEWGWNDEQKRWAWNPVRQSGEATQGTESKPDIQSEEQRRLKNAAKNREQGIGVVPPTSKELEQERAQMSADDMWGSDVVSRFRKNHPDVTDQDIMSGKYDGQLRKIGKALHGNDYVSKGDSAYSEIQRTRSREEADARRMRAEAESAERERQMTDKERGVVKKARDLFGDLWEQADNWAVENHGQGLLFKDSYETARSKKFKELVEKRAKERGIQISNTWNSGKDVFGNYNPANVFDEAFGEGAGNYFGRGHGGQQERLRRVGKKDK